MTCAHMDFAVTAEINRIGTLDDPATDGIPTSYMADIRVACAECGEPFQWLGLPVGVNYDRPMVSVDGTEIRAPIWPAHEPPGPRRGPRGFHMDTP